LLRIEVAYPRRIRRKDGMADIERLLVEALDDLEMYMGLLAEGGPS
jgi:hypothetical protein